MLFDEDYLGSIEEREMRDTDMARATGAKVVGVYCALIKSSCGVVDRSAQP